LTTVKTITAIRAGSPRIPVRQAGPGEGAWPTVRSALRMPIVPRAIAAMPQGRAMKKPPGLRKVRRIERGPRKAAARAGMLPCS
jgi:hypothetical protein